MPEFLTMLKGVIDSPDIPLNVSRSYLQADGNVKKISSYITRKVADKLKSLFTNNSEDFQNKWNDIKIVLEYGMLTDEKFYEKANDFVLYPTTEGQYYTLSELKEAIKANQTDKNDTLVVLYAQNKEQQYTAIEEAKAKGYQVLLLDSPIVSHLIQKLEEKNEKLTFARVDAAPLSKLIQKDEPILAKHSEEEKNTLKADIEKVLPKEGYMVQIEDLDSDDTPFVINQPEFMRRMKEMSQYQQGMGFYAQMPDTYTIVLNSDHAIIKQILNESNASTAEKLQPIRSEIKGLQAREAALRQEQGKKKPEEVTQNEKDELKNTEDELTKQRNEKNTVIADYAKNNNAIHQLIDLALLQNGLLKGAALDKFIKRSVDLIK